MFGLKEKQNDLIDSMTTKFVEKADRRGRLLTILAFSLLGNFLISMIVLFVPENVMLLYSALGALSSKLSNILFLIPLVSGFMTAYAVFRLIFPDVENNRNLASGMMASFEYQNHSAKRYAIWLLSMIAGVSNTLVCLFWLRHTPLP